MDSTPSRIKPRSLSIGIFNANGIRGKKDQIASFLHANQLDVLLVQETFLKPSDRNPRIANYAIIRNDRVGSCLGGTLIYYKRLLHCCPLTPPPMTNLEASVCCIAMTGHSSVILASCYLSPTKTFIKSDLEALFNMGSSVILAGDFNSKNVLWNTLSTNRNGALLEKFMDEITFDLIAPLEPTHYSFNINCRPDILDIALLRNVALRLHSVEVLHELDSDHRPVVLKLGSPPNSQPRTRSIIDWKAFGKSVEKTDVPLLNSIPDVITTKDETDKAIDCFTSHLRSIACEASKEVPAEDYQRWALPEHLRELMRQKNAATRAYDKYRTEENRSRLRSLQRKVRQGISDFRNQKWDELLTEIQPSHLAYWRLARSMKSEVVSNMPPLDRPDHQTPAFEDSEKAECLAVSLETQCTPSLLPVDAVHLERVDTEVDRRSSAPLESPGLTPVTLREVKDLIKGLSPKKSPGADGVSNRMLRLLPEALLLLLVAIFNAALRNSHFPKVWKSANVIGIHKSGKPRNNPSSYRPISLLSNVGKLYERIILARIREFTSANNILIDEQFGFRPRHSCVQQVHRITEHILDGFSKFSHGVPTCAIFLDVAKAFDKVWHNGLVYKLYDMGMPDRLVLIIRDFLTDRSFRYKVEGSFSEPHPLTAGVPQGAVLSPTLYSLYTNDIPRLPNVHYALFADDTAVYATHCKINIITRDLQSAASDLGHWFRRWRIEVNPEKSAAVCFSRTKSYKPAPIKMLDRPIPWVNKVKYLGVTLDRKLTFRPHIKRVRNRAKFILGRLGILLNKNSKLSLRNKRTLYKTCVRPIMTYASVVFSHAAKSLLYSLQVVQNSFTRRAVGAPWFVRNIDLHSDLDLQSISHFFKQTNRRHFDNVPHHPNPLVRKAAEYTPQLEPRIRRPRHTLTDPDDPITLALAAEPSRASAARRSLLVRRTRRRGRPPRGNITLRPRPHLHR